MKEKHYKEQLSAFLNHELPAGEQQLVGEHLLSCHECRQEHEEIKFGINLARNLQRADPSENVWRNIEAELDKRESGQTPTFSFLNVKTAVFASAVLIAVFAVLFYIDPFDPKPPESVKDQPKDSPPENSSAWQVETITGAPKIENSADNSNLKVGGLLETDGNSRAKIDVADIGQVEVAPNSLVKLINSSDKEHRLALERGALQARIYAPPRLFVVDTPTAAAVDLGCAYRIEVDDEGNSTLRVTSGYVSLEREGRESMVPAGAFCLTKRGKGLGTPFLETASAALKDALLKFDFGGGDDADTSLETILKEARAADTLTLWHLLSRVPPESREKVFKRAAALVKPPAGVKREGVLRLDKEMLERWRGEMELSWYVY